MLIRWLLILVAAADLSGCALGRDWVDITGHKRGESRAEADYNACVSEIPTSSTDRTPTYDEAEARRGKLLACMFSRGWRATSLQHL